MGKIDTHKLAIDGKDQKNLRGDPITNDRYFSKDFMQKEWDHMWTKVWLIAGREVQIKEPGDYIVHDLISESVIIVRQDDGSIKGFYNSCAHRGQRLVNFDSSQESFRCPYHDWQFGLNGDVIGCPDPDDFPEGSPIGKRKLVEVRVDTWDGFIFYTMNDKAPELLEYLDPLPEIYKNHNFKDQIRAQWVRVELDVNWKFFCDNFNESYHTRFVHPQVPSVIDQDHFTSRYEMFPKGHARIIQMGRPSLRDRVAKGEDHPFKGILEDWGVDTSKYKDYETLSEQGWMDLKKAKRENYKEKGYYHYENLSDEELTESPFQFVFPNIAMGVQADGCILLNWFPHPTDPEKCYFDLWDMGYPIGGSAKGIGKTGRDNNQEFNSTSAGIGETGRTSNQEYFSRTKVNPIILQEVELDFRDYDNGKGVEDLWDHVVYQDWQLTDGLRRGVRSRGYQEPYLASQETRVRFFHEKLHDYLNGNPPK
ncbi:aromatic ring-hydroxylating dioxygenase subunit alpha [Rhodobiaceae bacterium]|nr:aromatic ring-hydroxylating dioxygenase subunit alpha [Rhodobiaceae bacterium]